MRGTVTKVCGPRPYVVNVAGARRYVLIDHIISANAPSIDEPAVVNGKEQSRVTNRRYPTRNRHPPTHLNL